MTKPTAALPGLLAADGVGITLEAKLDLPPGKVYVVVGVAPDVCVPAALLGPDGQPTPEYREYLARQQEYVAARQALGQAQAGAMGDPQAAALWPVVGVDLQSAADAALQRWAALGHKARIERILAGGR